MPNTYPKTYTQTTLHSLISGLFGLALCFAGGITVLYFLQTTDSIAALIFIVLLPLPMLAFGVYLLTGTLRYKVTLTNDEIIFTEGISGQTEIPRDQIEAYRITSSKALELKLYPPAKNYSFSLVFEPDQDFLAWFDNITQVSEYKEPIAVKIEESAKLNETFFPRTYKPDVMNVFLKLSLASMFLYFPVTVYELYKNTYLTEIYKIDFWLIMCSILIIPYVAYKLIIETIGHRVILKPDMIEIKTLTGKTKIPRTQIKSYNYWPGRGRHIALFLLPSAPDSMYFEEKKIAISFEFDQEFIDWFSAIPCISGNRPLPKIREEL